MLLVGSLVLSTALWHSDPEWHRITSASGKTWFVDTSSIQIRGQTRKAWIKIAPENAKSSEYELLRMEFNCEDHTLVVVSSTTYKANGDTDYLDNFGPARDVPPGTIADTALTFVCAASQPN